MWKKVLGWALFFGGVFIGIAGVGTSLNPPPHGLYGVTEPINFVVVAFWVTVAVALIWGGWKLAHRKK